MTADGPSHRGGLIAVAIASLFVLAAGAILSADLRPLERDEATLYLKSLRMADRFSRSDGGLTDLVDESIRDAQAATPPGLRALHLPLLLLVGGRAAYLLLNLLLLIPLTIAMYGIGKRMAGPVAGNMALVFLFAMPSVLYLATRPTDAFPLMVLAVVATYLLLASTGLSRRWPTITAGVAIGLGILIAPRFFVCILGPLAWVLFAGHRDETKPHGPVSFPLGIGAAAVVALPWFLIEGGRYISGVAAGYSHGILYVLEHNYLNYIVFSIWQSNAHGAVLPLAAVGLVLYRRLPSPATVWLPVAWIGVALAFLLPTPPAGPDAIVPALPALAILAATGVALIRSARWRAVVIGVVLCVQAAGVWNVFASDRLPISGLNGFRGSAASERFAPLPLDWSVRRMAEAIAGDSDEPAYRPVRVAVLPDLPYLNAQTVAARAGMAGRFAEPVMLNQYAATSGTAALNNADFILLKEGFQGRSELAEVNNDYAAFLRRDDQARRLRYVATYSLPDGSLATLLKRPNVP